MLTNLDKALMALVSSGALAGLLPMIHGPFDNPSFTTSVVAVVTGIVTWLVPNKAAS